MARRPPPQLEEAVLARDGRREGQEIRFRCPQPEEHRNGDANPSARYNPRKQVWRCDACGAGGGWVDLCQRLNLPIPSAPDRDPAAVYEYRDESWMLLRQKLRWEPGFRGKPKSFSWQKPDGAGGWTKSKRDGNPRVLYHSEQLPALRESGGGVLVVEGEKDADQAASLGLVAVTNPEGAGKTKWKNSYSEQLRGLEVVILPDKDPPGRTHARAVAQSLQGVAASVSVLELPGEGIKDLSDWIAVERRAGGSQEEIRARLEALLAEAPPWEPNRDEGEDGDETDDTSRDGGKPTQSEILIRLADEAGVQLFHTQERESFALLPVNGHHETWRVGSKGFKLWLLHRYFASTGKAPNAQALQDARNTLAARGVFEGEEREVHTRVAQAGGAIYLDLCNDSWEAVEVKGAGWRLVPEPPVCFRREPGMFALPRPVPGGSIEELRPLVNVPDDASFALFVAFLVAALRPRGPYPLLVLHGEQGSAKSTLGRMARALVDPSGAPLRTLPRNERDLMISATHGWMLAFDNLSGLPDWLSDAFCRLSTGGGFAARELYTDSEEVIFSAMRPVILNGIDDVVGRQDLVDRSIPISLPAIRDDCRQREDELWPQFQALRPRLLGALLDAVSCALRRGPSVRLERSPRMADFAHWVVAAEAALPWPEGKFLEAYEGNRQEAVEVSLEADVVGSAVRALLADREVFEGTAQELLALLESKANDATRRMRSWPTSPRSLSSRLKRAAPALRQAGVAVIREREGHTGRRIVRIVQIEAASDRHDRHLRHEPPSDGVLGGDANGLAVTVASAERHPGDARATGAGDEGDGGDGRIQADPEVPAHDDPEELRL